MKAKAMTASAWMTAAAVCLMGGVAGATPPPSRTTMIQAVKQYVNEHADLCIGKSSWPRFVTEDDRRAGTNDALQLPVLERLGLVESARVPAIPGTGDAGAESADAAPAAASDSGPIERYSLTAKGRRFYLQKKMTALGPHGRPQARDADFCVARLGLDKVVKWTAPDEVHGHVETVVSYTYKIVQSAPWMADPEARKVFPVVDRIIHGESNALMTATLQAQDGRWVPVLPGQ